MKHTMRRCLLLVAAGMLVAGGVLSPTDLSPPLSLPTAAAEEPAAAKAEPAGGKPAPPAAQPAAQPAVIRRAVALPGSGKVAIIPIDGDIYGFTFDSMKRRVERSIAAGADVIVFELNTNGGMLDAALDISRYIRGKIERPDRSKIPTIAWINDHAYSAGILIASSCDQIMMAPAAMTGDCAPISGLGQQLMPTERAKVLSPLLEQFRSNATDNNYNYPVFQAMCVLGIKLYIIEHKTQKDELTGELRRALVNEFDYRVMVGGESAAEIGPIENAALGLVGDVTAVGGPKREVSTEADRGQWRLVETAHDGTTLLTVSSAQAIRLGLANEGTYNNDQDVQTGLGAAAVYRVEESWSETLAGFMVSLPVRAVLIFIMIVAIGIEMLTPGMGIPSVVAGVCMLILVISPFLVGLAEIWHLLLVVLGITLLLVEIFVTPGFGVVGITGIVMMIAGLVLAVVPTTGKGPVPLPAPEFAGMLQRSLMWSLAAFIAAAIGAAMLFRHYGSMPWFNFIALGEAQKPMTLASDGSLPGGKGTALAGADGGEMEDPKVAAVRRIVAGDDALGHGTIKVGDVGRTTMQLRPIGKAAIHGEMVDVATAGEWIDAGRPVRVVEVAGYRIVVEEERPGV